MGKTKGTRRRLSGGRLRLTHVPWRMYTRLVSAFEDRPRWKLTYDGGELEIMSPSLRHDDDGDYLGLMVRLMTEHFGLPVHGGGSVTMRRKSMKKGLEPDRCFWIAHAPQIAGVRRLDLRIHPPPDLAIEVDVMNSSLDRMGIYAALGVPEVWRLDDDVLSFQALGADGTYRRAESSPSFPGITPADLMPFMREAANAVDQNEVTRRFRDWLKERQPAQ